MSRINVQTKTNSPKEKVWEILADFGGIKKRAPNLMHSASVTPSNKGVGCGRTCEIKNLSSVRKKVLEQASKLATVGLNGLKDYLEKDA